MDENNRNFLLAIVLSIAVLFVWQYFFGLPKRSQQPRRKSSSSSRPSPGPPQPGGTSAPYRRPGPVGRSTTLTREQALAQSPRIAIDTPSLKGSIALKGGRIDDLCS